jgi:hypothetical protein
MALVSLPVCVGQKGGFSFVFLAFLGLISDGVWCHAMKWRAPSRPAHAISWRGTKRRQKLKSK